ncbi:MAG: TonB-dependent receptor [Bacteroidetes bacterium]|nr:TonB-dependent receptor [Bacteroidota bacterium]
MTKTITLIFLLLLSIAVNAQQKAITGKVTDIGGLGIPGVTVQFKGTSTGTITDIDGKYSIPMNQGILRFSYIGFVAQEFPITNQTTIDVLLLEEAKALNEVVVIGYGTAKKKDISTSISVVGEKDLKDRPITSPAQALQGKAAGVQVTSPSGKPGQALSVRVRGSTSIEASNEPLYVVDGVITSDISSINSNDIASLSILKDASAAAIYGVRGANGVVIITTKTGEPNSQSLKFNTYFGVSKLRKTVDVLGTKDYRTLMDEIYKQNYNWTNYTDWSKEVFGTGYDQSYQLSASGGKDKFNYYVSGGYLGNEGIVKPARFDRYSFRMNLDNQVNSWFKIGTNINIVRSKKKDTPDNASSGRGGVIMSTLNTPPFLHTYQGEGTTGYILNDTTHFDPNPFQPSWENPIAYMSGPKQETIDDNVSGSVFGEVSILQDLKFKSRLGVELNHHQWDYYLDPFRTVYGRQQHGQGQSDKSANQYWTWENTLDYAKIIGKHNFAAMVGNSLEKNTFSDSYLYGTGFPSDLNVTKLNAANTITGNTTAYQWSGASFFGRLAYNYNSKYYLTMSLREDGCSKLNHKWGTFPAISAAWRISSEDFMKSLSFIDDLKLRAGYGTLGNSNDIPPYTKYGLIDYVRQTGSNTPGSYLSSMGNKDLRWETTTQTDVGFDLTMLNSRITFAFDAYLKTTNDLYLNVIWPSSSNLPNLMTNAGSMENKGLEFDLNTVNLTGKLKWTSNFNISFNRNKIKSFKYQDVAYYGRIYSNNQDVIILKPGLSLGSFYGYVADGVDPATGDMKYKDVNNNGIFDPNDRTIIGNAQPKFTYGFSNNLSYGDFNLDIFFQGSQGNDIYNATRIDLEGMFDSKNQSTDVLRRWTPQNTITDIPRAIGGGNTKNVQNSSRFVEDGSYLRLKSISLSYKLLGNKLKVKGIKNLSLYVTGENLLTFTKYSGFDPEVNAYGNDAVQLGVDYGTYPQARTVIVGLNVEF